MLIAEIGNLYYFLGLGLTVLALVVAFAGIRFKNFPSSRGQLVGGLALFLVLVVGTMTFGVILSAHEKEDRVNEKAAETAANAGVPPEGSTAAPQGQNAAGVPTNKTPSGAGTADGEAIFTSQGCSTCHTLKAAGSTGQIGPDLDAGLVNKSPNFIRTSIVDPNADITQGYPSNVMPQNFGDQLSPDQLSTLVQYLVKSTQG